MLTRNGWPSSLVATALALITLPVLAHAADEVDYIRHIKPLLATHCYSCHGALKQEANLRLDTTASMLVGGDSGPALKANSAAESALLARARSTDADVRMPPEGKALSDAEIQLLERWISAGAIAPTDEVPQADPMQHWAFQAPQRAPLPAMGSPLSAGDNPIDRFLSVTSARLGTKPLDAALSREILRRVTLDLIGLPPTAEELRSFLNDSSPTAYEKVVDRLLQRPEYGQRWGRHWMDVWRYSDWYGRRAVPDVMNSYPQIWRWRDWIVRSLNADKGYDQMLVEMVAADEILPYDDENIVATGFIVRNWYKWNYETWMKDNVEHTSKAFLALTLNCAQCHDHKFDPISQEDYFRFRAFFEPLELRHARVAGEADPGPFQKYEYAKSYGPIKTGAIRIFDEKLEAQTFMFRGGDARNRIEGRPPVDAGPPRAFTPADFKISSIVLPPESFYPGLKPFVRNDELASRDAELSTAKQLAGDSQRALATSEEKLVQAQLMSAQPLAAASPPAPGQVLAAERAYADARNVHRLAVAAVDVAVAKRHALRCRIAADDATYRQIGDPDELARVAHFAEEQATLESAEHTLLAAEQALLLAERSAADAAADKAEAAKAAVTAALQTQQVARGALDAARAQLAKTETTYTSLSPKYPAHSTGRRAALARWLVADSNPLTARVAVNHMWLRHFGKPLVESVDNFGIQGKYPSHPELLDWLAVELVSSNWSMKAMHKLMVTSAAYRRSSQPGATNHPNFEVDRDNLSYWRYPTRRMEAEVVRDSVLACAGALDRKLDGPEIDVADWIKNPRRSLYFTQHGESQMLFLSTFDGANVCECYRRTSTVLPSQALAMSNSELLIHYGRICAQQLSKNVIADSSSNSEQLATDKSISAHENVKANEQFTQQAFETLLGRPASASELEFSLHFLAEQELLLRQPQTNAATAGAAGESSPSVATAAATPSITAAETANEAAIQPPASDAGQRARENLVMALFNHNDFVTIR